MDVPDEPFQDVNVSFRLRRARNLLTTSFNCSLVALPSFSPSLRASIIPKPLMSTNLRKLIVFSGKNMKKHKIIDIPCIPCISLYS